MTQDEPEDHHIAIVGLGYVGLPLALDLVDAGFQVRAIDSSAERVSLLRRGHSYVDDVPGTRLQTALNSGKLEIADTDTSWADSDAAFICVPTPVTPSREPDLSAVLRAGEYVRDGLRRGNLVVLQSTTYPGTTMGRLRTVLEGGSLYAGADFGLAFAPERISPGDGWPASRIPRLVGGIDAESTRRTAKILGRVSPSVTEMSTPDAAELAKLFENVFRNVNIGLVNELALICERLGLDVWEVIDGASTKPFGFMPFYPGPGVGGHCIPVDPYYLSARAREVGLDERFIEAAGDVNAHMPQHVLALISSALNERGKAVRGSAVLVIGVAFKPNVSDTRNSPAGPITIGLLADGATVTYHDPFVDGFRPEFGELVPPGIAEPTEIEVDEMRSVSLRDALDAAPDCVVIVTPHSRIDLTQVFDRADLIVDTRNASVGHRPRPGQVLRLGAGWSK